MATDNEQIKALRERFDSVCNDYIKILEERWEVAGTWSDASDLYWFCETEALSLSDVIFCVEEGIELDEYFEWSEYNEFAREFKQNVINLRSWHMGWHGIPKESQDSLRRMKKAFEDAVNDYKERF